MSHSTPTPRHPLAECADALEKALAGVNGVDPAWLRTGEKADLLRRFTTLASQVEALRLRVLAGSDDLALERADKQTADWLARETRTDPRTAHAQHRLAEALQTRWPRLGQAVADGRVHLDQARVILRALDALPGDIGPEVRRLAEDRLIAEAATFAPRDLTRLGERILTLVAPEVGDAAELKALERAEAAAETHTRLTYHTRQDGTMAYTGVLPPVEGAILKTALEALMSPRRREPGGGWTDPATGQRLTAERLRGEAFRDLLTRLDLDKLGQHGGKSVSLFLTIPLDHLTDHPNISPTTTSPATTRPATTVLGTAGLGRAVLSTGEPITAGQARRLACTAGLIPAVLGTDSEVLDLGRAARLHTPAQRKAKLLTTPHCQTQDCTVPAAWCDSHHPTPWARGGHTNHDNHVLLCGWHHRAAHNPHYEATHHPNGTTTFHRRT